MFCEPKRLEHSSHLFWRHRLNPWSYGVQLLSLHAQNAVSLELESDGGLVVLRSGILQHRTATTADKRTTLLPFVCLGGGLMDEPWAAAWLMLMQDQEWDEQRGYIFFQRSMS